MRLSEYPAGYPNSLMEFCDPSSGKCEEVGLTDTITVNNQSIGDVVGLGGELTAELKFGYTTGANQMPIRTVIVQGGDGYGGYNPGPDNSFPNRRGMKPDNHPGVSTDSLCNNTDFGHSPEACIDRPFTITRTYTCGGVGSLPTCTTAGGTRPGPGQESTGCYDPSFARPGSTTGACIYIPRVHVKDNWGYCNGRCPNTGAAGAAAVTRLDGEKCFDGTGLGGGGAMEKDECNTLSVVQGLDPWTYFQGRVIVGPP